jgi:hypothetical protein
LPKFSALLLASQIAEERREMRYGKTGKFMHGAEKMEGKDAPPVF